MAISLKKHTPGAGEQESARLNDVNSNWGTIEQAINDLQANASLSEIVNIGGGITYRKCGKVCFISIQSLSATVSQLQSLPTPVGYMMIQTIYGTNLGTIIQYRPGYGWSFSGTVTAGYGSAVYLTD